MKIPYFCCIGAELKRYAQDFDFMNQVYLYKVPTDDTIEEVFAQDYFQAVATTVLQDDILYIYQPTTQVLYTCRFNKQNGHITAEQMANNIPALTANKILISDEDGKITAGDLSLEDIVVKISTEKQIMQGGLQTPELETDDLTVNGTAEFDNAPTTNDTTTYQNATSDSLVRKEQVDEVVQDIKTSSLTFIGYVSTTAPSSATYALNKHDLWLNSATMPTTFPFPQANIKEWNGSAWVAHSQDYTPANFEFFRNINDNEGYYWFGGEWVVMSTDMSTTYFQLNPVSGKWEIKSNVNLPGAPTTTTPSTDDNSTKIATTEFTGKAITASKQKTISNCITEIPQDIKLELTNGTLTLKAGSKVYVPNGAGVFATYTAQNDISSNSFAGSVTRFVFIDINNNTINAASAVFSGTTAPTLSGTGFWYDTTNNVIKRTTDSGATWTTGYSFPIAIVTSVNDVATSIDQVFNGFGYIGSTIFALPGVKGLMPSGRNADGTLNNTAFTVNNVITKTTSYDFGFDCNFMIRDGSTIDYVKNSFYLISEKTPSFKQYARLYQTTKNKCYYGEPSSWEPIQFVFCGTMTLDSNGKIIKFDSRLVFEAVDSTEGDYVVDYQRPTAENNYTWYRKYKSGWVEQGGQFTATSVADGSGTAGNNIINLPIEMANNRYWYSANVQVGGSGWEYANGVILNARSTTTMTLKAVAGTGDIPLYWEVKGMAAS